MYLHGMEVYKKVRELKEALQELGVSRKDINFYLENDYKVNGNSLN